MLPKTPTKGMRDFLPEEFALRQHVLSVIQQTYSSYGFTRIETPAVENIALLTSKQGGDNEKLIFKILKRGEKLDNARSPDDMCDLALRYDLTVPLSRFYANNQGQLPGVFKAIQMDNVWRATVRKEVVSASLCSVTSTSSAKAPTLPKRNLFPQLPRHLQTWDSTT